MRLNNEQLNLLFGEYLTSYVLPGSKDHLPMFDSLNAGSILTKRLRKIIRDPKLLYTDHSDTVDIEELSRVAQRHLKKHPKVFIVGLNHWFTLKDVEVLYEIYDKYFGK